MKVLIPQQIRNETPSAYNLSYCRAFDIKESPVEKGRYYLYMSFQSSAGVNATDIRLTRDPMILDKATKVFGALLHYIQDKDTVIMMDKVVEV